MLPLIIPAFGQASNQTSMASHLGEESAAPNHKNTGCRLHNAVSMGSGVGVSLAMTACCRKGGGGGESVRAKRGISATNPGSGLAKCTKTGPRCARGVYFLSCITVVGWGGRGVGFGWGSCLRRNHETCETIRTRPSNTLGLWCYRGGATGSLRPLLCVLSFKLYLFVQRKWS